MEINEDHPDENKHTIHSELALVRELATITCFWQRLRQVAWESFRMDEREGTDVL